MVKRKYYTVQKTHIIVRIFICTYYPIRLTNPSDHLTILPSFLIHFVPQGEKISLSMWGAVGLGLLGSCLVALGGISAETSDMAAVYPDEFRGVCLLLTASLAISMATIRLGTLGESATSCVCVSYPCGRQQHPQSDESLGLCKAHHALIIPSCA